MFVVAGIDWERDPHERACATNRGTEVFPGGRLLLLRKCRGEVGICYDTFGRSRLPARPPGLSSKSSIEVEPELHILAIGIVQHAFARQSRSIRYHNSLDIQLACDIDHGAQDFPIIGDHSIGIRISAPKKPSKPPPQRGSSVGFAYVAQPLENGGGRCVGFRQRESELSDCTIAAQCSHRDIARQRIAR